MTGRVVPCTDFNWHGDIREISEREVPWVPTTALPLFSAALPFRESASLGVKLLPALSIFQRIGLNKMHLKCLVDYKALVK